jgi:hypothetical protein
MKNIVFYELMNLNIVQVHLKILEKIDQVCRIIERENPDLDGVLTNAYLTMIIQHRPLQPLIVIIHH